MRASPENKPLPSIGLPRPPMSSTCDTTSSGTKRLPTAAKVKAPVAELTTHEEKRHINEEEDGRTSVKGDIGGGKDTKKTFKNNDDERNNKQSSEQTAASAVRDKNQYAPYGYSVSPSGNLVPMSYQEAAYYSQSPAGRQQTVLTPHSPRRNLTRALLQLHGSR